MKKHILKVRRTLVTIGIVVGLFAGVLGIVGYFKEHPLKDVSGKWKMVFHINSSSLKRYVGKTAEHIVFLKQDGNDIKGEGELWGVDGKEVPFSQHIQTIFDGILKGKILKASYKQFGEKRTTIGEVSLVVKNKDEMEGTFSGTAADSKGTVEAFKIN